MKILFGVGVGFPFFFMLNQYFISYHFLHLSPLQYWRYSMKNSTLIILLPQRWICL